MSVTGNVPHRLNETASDGIIVKGVENCLIRFSKCCSPVPGDEIVGFITRGRGISVHRTDCVNVINLPEFERERLIDAEWQEDALEGKNSRYLAEIRIYANNRTGILVDVSKILTERQIDVITLNSRANKQGKATISISFEISSKDELNHIIEKLRNVESVIDIERTSG